MILQTDSAAVYIGVHLLMPAAVVPLFIRLRCWSKRSAGLALVALWLGLTALDAALFGVGWTWRTWSVIGKSLATLIAIGIPLSIAILTAHVLGRKGLPQSWQTVGGIATGMASMLLQPFIGLIFACALTGDCL